MVPHPLPCLMATSTLNFPHPHACACYVSSGVYLLARLQLTSKSGLVFIYRRRHWFHFWFQWWFGGWVQIYIWRPRAGEVEVERKIGIRRCMSTQWVGFWSHHTDVYLSYWATWVPGSRRMNGDRVFSICQSIHIEWLISIGRNNVSFMGGSVQCA